jgi:hypothetical protein
MKKDKPLIISIAAARNWKWKKPSPAGCAARSLEEQLEKLMGSVV